MIIIKQNQKEKKVTSEYEIKSELKYIHICAFNMGENDLVAATKKTPKRISITSIPSKLHTTYTREVNNIPEWHDTFFRDILSQTNAIISGYTNTMILSEIKAAAVVFIMPHKSFSQFLINTKQTLIPTIFKVHFISKSNPF